MHDDHDFARRWRNLACVLTEASVGSGDNYIGSNTRRIAVVDRIVADISVEVEIADAESDRVFRRPAPGVGIVIAYAKPHQLGLVVSKSAGEAKGLEPRIGVAGDDSEFVVIDTLNN